METLPNGVTLRDFYSPKETRAEILRRVHDEMRARFPIENDRVKLDLLDSGYDPNKSEYSLEQYQDAILKGKRLAVPLRGKVRLTEKATGMPLDEKELTLANVPYMTDDGTFVYGGNHYATSCQFRLKPGIYHRRQENGMLESHINVKPGTGQSLRLYMEPDTGVFRAHIGQATIKLYPVLKTLGVPDKELEQSWGPQVLQANRDAYDHRAFDKFYAKLLDRKAVPEATEAEKSQAIHETLARMESDPEVNNRTLGKPHTNMSPQALVDSSAKLLRISRGEDKEDNRDHPANRTIHSVDDFLAERVRRDAGGLGRNLLYKATYDRSLKQLRPGYFSPQLEGLIVSNSLSAPIPGINPVEVFDQQKRVIQTGEGAVSSQDAVPMSARGVQPGQAGIVDPIRSAESGAIGVDQRLTIHAKKGSDNNVYYPLRNKRTGKIEYLNPTQLNGKVVAFPESESLEPHRTVPGSPLKLAGDEQLTVAELLNF